MSTARVYFVTPRCKANQLTRLGRKMQDVAGEAWKEDGVSVVSIEDAGPLDIRVFPRNAVVVLLGKTAAKQFQHQAEPMNWVTTSGRFVVSLPHPRVQSAWWNVQGNAEQAARTLCEAFRRAYSEQEAPQSFAFEKA